MLTTHSRHRRAARRRGRRSATTALLAALAGALMMTTGIGAAATALPEPETPDPQDLPAAVEPEVLDALKNEGASDLWVVFDDRPDLTEAYTITDWDERGRYVHEALTKTAATSQADLIAKLGRDGVDVESYWIVNALLVRAADPATLDTARAADGVAEITADVPVTLPEPVIDELPALAESPPVEWGVADIGADTIWQEFGVRGEGIVVGSIDTGVDFAHPALASQYRGYLGAEQEAVHDYNWWDPAGICPTDEPCDSNDHGTHTVGTMVGDGGPGNRIGVAPEAQWIAAKGCEGTSCSTASLLSSGQFMLAPTDVLGNDARPELRPHIVNNSWGGDRSVRWYDGIVEAWTAAGMFPVFANGNDGPSCGTVGNPGDGEVAWGVGAHDSAGIVAPFSSRGPGPDDRIKPNVSAPGVAVRSSIRSDGSANYGIFSGTSMAAPHQSGAIALLWSASPSLVRDIDTTKAILAGTAEPVDDTSCGGTPEHNNVYGHGHLDAHAAVREAFDPTLVGTAAGTVTDEAGAPLVDIEVAMTGQGVTRRVITGEDGHYRLGALPPGAYQITVSGFGYLPATGELEVAAGEVSNHDAVLEAKATYDLAGTVTDSQGRPPLTGGTVTVLDTPLPAVDLGEDGEFAVDALPVGDYVLQISADGCHAVEHATVTIEDGPVTRDVALEPRTDGYGHTCALEPADYVELDDEPLQEFANPNICIPVSLPFAFSFYGEMFGESDWNDACVAISGGINLDGNVGNPVIEPLPTGTTPRLFPYNSHVDYASDLPQVRTAVLGEPGDRRLVVEWTGVRLYIPGPDAAPPIDFQAVIYESGEVRYQYRGIDPDNHLHRGAISVVGMQSGGDAFSYMEFGDIMTDDYAIRFLPPDARLGGTVHDAAQEAVLPSARITASQGDHSLTTVTRGDGTYNLGLPESGAWNVSITRPGYQPDVQHVEVGPRGGADHDVALATGVPQVTPETVDMVVPAGSEGSGGFEVGNSGSAPFSWSAVTDHYTGRSADGGDTTPGSVRESWKVLTDGVYHGPNGLAFADGTVWVAIYDPLAQVGVVNREYTLDGTPTGREWPVPTPESEDPLAPTSLTYDPGRGWLCQMFTPDDYQVGGNTIVCWDPDTGDVQETLPITPWEDPEGQASFTYDPHQDIFYVGQINTRDADNVYRLAGFAHDTPGEVLGSCPVDGPRTPNSTHGFAMGELAFRQTDGTLQMILNMPEPFIRTVDPRTCQFLKDEEPAIPPPDDAFGLWPPMNFAFDFTSDGDRLVGVRDIFPLNADGSPQGWSGYVHLVTGDVPAIAEQPWVAEVAPEGGSVAAGESDRLTVGVDAAELTPDQYAGEVLLVTDAGRHEDTRLRLPYTLHVVEPAACDRTVSGTHRGPLTIRDGVTCLADGAEISGPVTVEPGASLVAGDARISGSVTASEAAVVELVGTTVRGKVVVAGTTGRVVVDGTHVHGTVTVTDSRTGDLPVVVAATTVTGSLRCTGNEPTVVDSGRPNDVQGPIRGECSGA